MHIVAYHRWTRRKTLHLIMDDNGKVYQEHRYLTDAFDAMLALDITDFIVIHGKTQYRLTVQQLFERASSK